MTEKQVIRFGLIGAGLMGREFASACARWCHLLDLDFEPRVVGICALSPLEWYEQNCSDLILATRDYQEMLRSSEIDAIYCAVPHHLHAQIYADVIRAGKHMLGEKPFGIDLAANTSILAALDSEPQTFVRCSSEFPFYPGAQRIVEFIQDGRFGRIMEVEAGFWHSSDLDPQKPINWKRMIEFNGEYGCMGDLGMHVVHIPLRFGWFPTNLRAFLSKIVTQRPDGDGHMVPCETWDNASIACEVRMDEQQFPMFLSTKRIAPGEMNTWFIRILGTEFSAEFSTKYPCTLRTMTFVRGQPQSWEVRDLGYEAAYPSVTGRIFEFGFSDAVLQMVAAFCDELVHGPDMRQPFRCVTPEETLLHHRILSGALESQRLQSVVHL